MVTSENIVKKSSHTYDAVAAQIMSGDFNRGHYDEIIINGLDLIDQHFAPCLPDTYCDFDRKGRGAAQNIDLYGLDASQNVAVYQIRLAHRMYKNGYMNVRKSYCLVGFNDETGEPFRHPVGAHKIRAAVRKSPNDPAAIVRAAQEWMWELTSKQLDRALAASQRQGDVIIVKTGLPKAAQPIEVPEEGYPLGGDEASHLIISSDIRELDGKIYAWEPKLKHRKDQHCLVFAGEGEGWYSCRVAREEAAWDFAQRFGD